MLSCASGWRAWRTNACMERHARRLRCAGMLNSSACSHSAVVPAIRMWMAELRKVARDAYVDWQGSRYSVPWQYAGKEV